MEVNPVGTSIWKWIYAQFQCILNTDLWNGTWPLTIKFDDYLLWVSVSRFSNLINLTSRQWRLFQYLVDDFIYLSGPTLLRNLFNGMNDLAKMNASHTEQLLRYADISFRHLTWDIHRHSSQSLKSDVIGILVAALRQCQFIYEKGCKEDPTPEPTHYPDPWQTTWRPRPRPTGWWPEPTHDQWETKGPWRPRPTQSWDDHTRGDWGPRPTHSWDDHTREDSTRRWGWF